MYKDLTEGQDSHYVFLKESLDFVVLLGYTCLIEEWLDDYTWNCMPIAAYEF